MDGRQRDLLSDGELALLYFIKLLPGFEDCREQFPLSTNYAQHPLSCYLDLDQSIHLPGTLDIANHLGIKHPMCTGKNECQPWVGSTDAVILLNRPDQSLEMLAIAYKQDDWKTSKRTKELLLLEKSYWAARDIDWLLITPETFDTKVAETLRRTEAWALGNDIKITDSEIELTTSLIRSKDGNSLKQCLEATCMELHCAISKAQRAFWKAVWRGQLTIDLRIDWRPNQIISIVSSETFQSFNPVASRRSAWF